MSATPYRVLFVCMGNICRSPAADNVFAHLLESLGHHARITCDSAGTINYHAGNPPDHRMSETLEARGIPVQGAARQFQRRDFDDFDLILTMDEDNRRGILSLAKTEDQSAKIRRFTDFCANHDADEVPDPYYGGPEGFELVADMIEDGCAGLLDHILTEIDP